MTVKNISSTGIGFETYNPHDLAKDDAVRVKFALDDAKRSEIERDVTVRVVRDRYIGGEFSAPDLYDKTLGFYLMP
jgi:hypothetical protein